jgi:serine/threonine protein kinase
LIGSGSFGSVYNGVLDQEERLVVVKVLNLEKKGAPKSFVAECNVLRNVRHRSLIKILTCCSSINYNGDEFKALVFEFMTNGNLDMWLHPMTDSGNQSKQLSVLQRLIIAIDVASALNYLHNHCEQQIIHCDLKPSNILLDNEMIAHVSDFCLARFLSTTHDSSQKCTSTIGLMGSIGYACPGISFPDHF